MKKSVLLLIGAVLACAVFTSYAHAASQNITITATVSGVQGVSLSGTTWSVGAINAGSSADSSTITATNSGTMPEKLLLSATSTGDFTLASTADINKIAIWGKCASADPTLVVANALTGTAAQNSATVNPAANLKVFLKYFAPASITAGKTNGAATVTVSTIAP